MKYLVTGGTGLLGNNIVRLLAARGEQVRVLTRAGSDPRPFQGLDVELHVGDVTDAPSVERATQGMDAIIHSAGHVQIGWLQAGQHQAVNVEGAKNVAAAARKAKRRGKAASPREADPACEPSQTALGRKLRALSKKYIEGGGKLLTVEEINVEVAENRGER